MSSKGNLLKHLQVAHHDALKSHKEDRRMSLASGQSTLTGENPRKSQPRFHNQDTVVTSLALNMCGHGGLPIQMCEQPWFCRFIHDIEPRFTPVSRVTVKRMLGELYANKRDVLLSNIVSISLCKPSVTADFWPAVIHAVLWVAQYITWIMDALKTTHFSLKKFHHHTQLSILGIILKMNLIAVALQHLW